MGPLDSIGWPKSAWTSDWVIAGLYGAGSSPLYSTVEGVDFLRVTNKVSRRLVSAQKVRLRPISGAISNRSQLGYNAFGD